MHWGLDRFEELASARRERLTRFAERMEELAVMDRHAPAPSAPTSPASRERRHGHVLRRHHALRAPAAPLDRFLAPYVQEARRRREVRSDLDAAQAAEWIARVSFAIGELPSVTFDVRDEKALRRFVRRFLIPGLK